MSFVSALSEKVSGLLRSAETSSISKPANWLVELLGGQPSEAGVRIGPSRAMQVSVFYACVRNIAEDVAKLRAVVYKAREDGGRDEAKSHRLSKLLREPNGYQDRFQFMEQIVLSLLLRGNAYIVILRDYRAEPRKLVVISPDRVTLLEAPDGSLFYQILRGGAFERAQLEDSPFAIPAYDVIHVKLLSPHGLIGLSPVAQAKEALGLAVVAEKHQAKLFANGARPGGVLKHPKTLSEAAALRLKVNWNNAQGGQDNTGKTALLEEGMDWVPLGMTSVDAEFMAGRRFSVEEICRWFRMPPHMVGDLSRSTNNNIAHQGTEYLTNTLTPYLERIEAAFDRAFDLYRLGYFLEFSTEGLTRGDALTQAKTDQLQRAGGWLTQNEARIKRGLNPKPGGDVLERPMNKQPADGQGPNLGDNTQKEPKDTDAEDEP